MTSLFTLIVMPSNIQNTSFHVPKTVFSHPELWKDILSVL